MAHISEQERLAFAFWMFLIPFMWVEKCHKPSRRSPSANQTWPWTNIHYSSVIVLLKAQVSHEFPSLPCLITPGGYPKSSPRFTWKNVWLPSHPIAMASSMSRLFSSATQGTAGAQGIASAPKSCRPTSSNFRKHA